VATLCIEQQQQLQLELQASGLDELGQYRAVRVVGGQDQKLLTNRDPVRSQAGGHVPLPPAVLPHVVEVRLNGLGQRPRPCTFVVAT
jgi:hypothetical protein